MRVFRKLMVAVCFILLSCIVNAQVSFISKSSASTIGKNDLLEVNYEVHNGTMDDFVQPDFSGWQVAGGPNISSSTFISNGEKTTTLSYQFLLKPLRTGKFTIPGAKAVVNGKQVLSNSLSVTVINKSTSNNNQPQPGMLLPDPMLMMPPELSPGADNYENYDGYLLKDDENILEKTKKNLFVLVDVSKRTCYPGEAVKAVYKLYSRVNLDAHITKRPSFSGFSSVDLPDPANNEFEFETRNGKKFKVYTVRSVQLYPLLTGSQTLEPVEIEASIQYKKVPSGNSGLFYDPYAPSSTVNYPYTIKSEPVKVEVIPFPDAGKPSGFNGVTGKFNIVASLDQKKLALNEAGTLKLEISGQGNWAMVQAPVIKWPKNIDVYEPTTTEKLDSQAIPISGKRIYEYPFSTNKPGKFTIPAISLTYFSPEQKKYSSSNTQVFNIEVLNNSRPVNGLIPKTYKGLSGADNTQIFTDIIKIAFPMAAILLAIGLVISYRRRKMVTAKQKHLKVTTPPVGTKVPEHTETTDFKRFTPGAGPITGKSIEQDKLQDPEIEPGVFHENKIPESTIPNELAALSGIDSRGYFTAVKQLLLAKIATQWNMFGPGLMVTRENLMEHGFTNAGSEKIINLLEVCQRYIYSPFSESFDKPHYDRLLLEMLEAISRSKPQH